MMKEPLNIVVTGDIDSGKSTLIGRFLYDTGSVPQKLKSGFEFAYLLDSFEEERENNLTIDTAQVYCKSKNSAGFIFIDVPGHQQLIKNMLCGSSYADMAILVVDVKKSIQEQTKRHAFILEFLGIERVIVVLNKMDLVGFKENIFHKVKEEFSELFKKIKIQPKYFIPISAKQGDNLLKLSKNIPRYKGLSLIEVLNTCSNRANLNSGFRFPIQDIYNMNGVKIAVGRIISGKIKKGDKVNILPLNKECRVKAIKVFNKNRHTAKAPESIGLILNEMGALSRGQVICKPRLPEVKTEILAKIFCVLPLNIKESLGFRCSTQDVPCQINQITSIWDSVSLEAKPKNGALEKNDFAEVIINTERPVVIERFKELNNLGRFVLQDAKEIYAVGII